MGGDKDRGEVDQRLVRALAHPLRVEIFRILECGPKSPKQISDQIDELLGNVSYHMKVLLDYDFVELVDNIPRRGAVEHVYALKRGGVGSRNWQEVPPSVRTSAVGSALAGFVNRAIEALDAGTVESREGSGVNWFPLIVDETGWEELREMLDEVEGRFRAVGAKSAKRLDKLADGIPLVVVLGAFESARGDTDVDSKR
jgi:DNA-binding transcriptional ArsR family regulator